MRTALTIIAMLASNAAFAEEVAPTANTSAVTAAAGWWALGVLQGFVLGFVLRRRS